MARYLAPTKQIPVYKFGPRFFSNKQLEQLEMGQHLGVEEKEENSEIPAIRYNVCRDRSGSSTKKYNFPKTSQSTDQSSKLENFDHSIENRVPTEHNKDQKIELPPPSAGYRQFEASSTYKNLVLPLKVSKLSNPFPSPVKMMRSHTVSDQEKADQMQSERRVPRSIARKKAT
ncbi:unnamed protein product [Ceutorhynchus assimilis]|uniref:Uncharacterized protein n=1 Tax=Ceutorhynchus assimilis TaxID=467358 RepID=A0A9N9QJJ8_9CUCU|nr:unnamed protein product [Ceutorhynchus assimilis]